LRQRKAQDAAESVDQDPQSEEEEDTDSDHKCTQNWGENQSSGSMEASIISEGFAASIEMHGIVYKVYCGDGDSSVKKALVVNQPYVDDIIVKIECKNHLWRAYNGHMKNISTTSHKSHPPALRRVIARKSLGLRRKVNNYIKQRFAENSTKEQKSVALKEDIVRSLRCLFGDHEKCDKNNENICSEKDREDPINYVTEMKKTTLWETMNDHLRRLINNSRSLIENMDSNIVECMNSVLARFCLNKSKLISRTYRTRVNAAIISFNTRGKLFHKITHRIFNRSPGTHSKKIAALALRKSRPKSRAPRSRKKLSFAGTDKHYGPKADTPPKEGKELEDSCKIYLDGLEKTRQEIIDFERNTIFQAESDLWKLTRKKLLTASNHGKVCKKLASTKCGGMVTEMLYGDISFLTSIQHGKKYEEPAKECLSKLLNIIIEPAGLFICPKNFCLGASPDGLVGNDTIVEIKCPDSAKYMTPEEGIRQRKIDCWQITKDGNFVFNRRHDYYYQVQSQLEYSNRAKCIFAVYTLKEPHIKYEVIHRDAEFYKNEMEGKLLKFYHDCLLPELADSMKMRRLPIREPDYIIEAFNKKVQAKAEREAKAAAREAKKRRLDKLVGAPKKKKCKK
jgi:hypothetical protein